MANKCCIGVLIVVVILVIPLLKTGETSRPRSPEVQSPTGFSFTPTPKKDPQILSLPVDEPEPEETAEDIASRLVSDFNSRYGYELATPNIEFVNATHGEYFEDTLFIPRTSEYTISHETCHYFQDRTCHFEGYGESFCEVFAHANRSKEECEENGWPYYYCAPFRLEDVDRQGFVDCVFETACMNGATKEELMRCYNQNKL